MVDRALLYVSSLPPAPGPVHFVGIGGIGMSALARILLAWGFQITGSDVVSSDITRALEAEGISVGIGHTSVEEAKTSALVVVTAAIRGDNPEIAAAQAANVPIVKRAQLLGMLANARTCVAVAGSHGKSTTSGMITTALLALGADPSYAIGAVVASTGTNAAPGLDNLMVVEADEYDYSFLSLNPDVAIVTNVEYDHPDLFPDQEAYDDAFADFVANIRPGGMLIVAGDDPGCARLRSRLSDIEFRFRRFGETPDVEYQLLGSEGNWSVRAPAGGEVIPLELSIPGRHNARNAIAAAMALVALDFTVLEAIEAVSTYKGVGRRFDFKGESDGVIVIDDYAHHPTEVQATLRAARERYPGKRLWAVFQPHTFSRTKALLGDFAESFGDADRVVILDIYPSRETDSLGISSSDLIRLIPNGAVAGGSPADAVELLNREVAPDDVVLTLGAGDVTTVGPMLLECLRARETSPRWGEVARRAGGGEGGEQRRMREKGA
jgi:UDP-N-acetylmuramate--alanine ligase